MPGIGLREGCRFEWAAPYAIRLGIALQLTNILRDVGEDAGRGRVCLPEGDLARFGLTRADILAGVHEERFVVLRLKPPQIEEVRGYLPSSGGAQPNWEG